MSKFPLINNTLSDKILRAGKLILYRDIRKLIYKLIKYIRYKLKEQWEFIYFELPLNEANIVFISNNVITIRPAVRDDIPKIETDIYPYIGSHEENDKRYISAIGTKGFKCFIAEKDNKIVHYFQVFERALKSPLIDTPFNKANIRNEDVYLGSAFTSPNARGMWIMPYSLSKICDYLKTNTDATRVLVLVHKDTPGAVSFYKRLGFKQIADSCSGSFIEVIKQKLRRY